MAPRLDPRAMTRICGKPSSDNARAVHLLECELADRWRLSIRTLQRWRRAGRGPAFLRLGHRIAYRLVDIECFEEAARRSADPS